MRYYRNLVRTTYSTAYHAVDHAGFHLHSWEDPSHDPLRSGWYISLGSRALLSVFEAFSRALLNVFEAFNRALEQYSLEQDSLEQDSLEQNSYTLNRAL